MIPTFRYQGVLHLMFLTSFSLQMDHPMNLINFHSAPNHPLESVSGLNPSEPFGPVLPTERPILKLSLGLSNNNQIIDNQHSITVCTDQGSFGGRSAEGFTHNQVVKKQGAYHPSSREPWISLAQPGSSGVNKVPKHMEIIEPQYGSSTTSHEGPPNKRKWLTLSPQKTFTDNLEDDSIQTGILYSHGDMDRRVSKGKYIRMEAPRGNTLKSDQLKNHIDKEKNHCRSSLDTGSINPFYQTQETLGTRDTGFAKYAVCNLFENSDSQSQDQTYCNLEHNLKMPEEDLMTENTMHPGHKDIKLDCQTISKDPTSKRDIGGQGQIDPTRVPVQESSSLVQINTERSFVETVNYLGKFLISIPGKMEKEIELWFYELKYTILQRVRLLQYDGFMIDRITRSVSKFISKAEKELTISFLTCLKLLHEHKVWGSKDWDQMILEDGWNFVQRIFIQLKMLDPEKIIENGSSRSNDHVDNLQPSALYAYMIYRNPDNITIELFWGMWKKWYRESKLPHKRFIATRNHFDQQLKMSMINTERIKVSRKEKAKNELFQESSGHVYHEDLLNNHFLQFPRFLSVNYKLVPQTRNSAYLIQHVGELEVELLEHHEPVAEWFEKLGEDLRAQLHKSGIHDRDSTQALSKCVKDVCTRLLPKFFGLLKMMEDPKPLVLAREVDLTVLKGWEFMKNYIGHWRHIEFGKGLQNPIPKFDLEDCHSGESYSLFLKLLKGREWHTPFEYIWKLYYLHTTSPLLHLNKQETRKQATVLHKELTRRVLNLKSSLDRKQRDLLSTKSLDSQIFTSI
ncbi:hypothetical protein DFH28DRAFT_474744 [Melampsora americana]|nr:hypothetical protein DFH28DRAFT_474744 [Melampsora americana]